MASFTFHCSKPTMHLRSGGREDYFRAFVNGSAEECLSDFGGEKKGRLKDVPRKSAYYLFMATKAFKKKGQVR